jgi:predicted nucleic acid-binding protein
MENLTGLDSNILAYALDPTFPEHRRAKEVILGLSSWYVNPTVLHEVYHTLVFKRKMRPKDAAQKLIEFLSDERTLFLNQTKLVSSFALDLASEHDLGGRDSLIIGCYLYNRITKILTHDEEILRLGPLRFRGRAVRFEDPVKS